MPELVQEHKQHDQRLTRPVPPFLPADAVPNTSPDSDDEDEPVIPVTRSHLLACSFPHWWPLMKRHTIASRVIALPDEFVAYLQEDGMQLPEKMAPARAERDELDDSDSEWSDEEGENAADSEEEDGADAVDPASFFPSLVSAIDSAIDALGGCVHPRLDWHSPSDASWITCDKTTRCHTAADVILLLKASDNIAQELSNPFTHTSPPDTTATAATTQPQPQHRPSLVLRRWSNLYPSSRFRVFTFHDRLLAISQHDANYYRHLTSSTHRQRTTAAIAAFVQDEALSRLGVEGEGRVLDVYVDGEERVWLVDVKPWSTRTDPALFTWNELLDMAAEAEGAEGSGGEGGEGGSEEEEEEVCEYRVVESGGDNTYMLRVARRSLRRLPNVDGIDLSDAAGIERFAAAMDKLQ